MTVFARSYCNKSKVRAVSSTRSPALGSLKYFVVWLNLKPCYLASPALREDASVWSVHAFWLYMCRRRRICGISLSEVLKLNSCRRKVQHSGSKFWARREAWIGSCLGPNFPPPQVGRPLQDQPRHYFESNVRRLVAAFSWPHSYVPRLYMIVAVLNRALVCFDIAIEPVSNVSTWPAYVHPICEFAIAQLTS